MYMRLAAILPIAALVAVATAAPNALEARGSSSSGSCNTGSINCCNQTYSSSSSALTTLLGLLNIAIPVGTLTSGSLVGYQCSSVVGSTSCTQQPVCCSGDTFSGVIVVGCSPININA